MSMGKRAGYAKFDSPLIKLMLRHPLGATASHWLFQSLLYMDVSERWFKIGIDLVLTAVGTALFGLWLSWPAALACAFVLSHTLNFLLNGHLWGALKHYGLVSNSYEAFQRYVDGVSLRVDRESSIERTLVCGSLARDEWSPSSDLDVRLVRRPGLPNAIRACWFALSERSRALVARFPLDMYVLDHQSSVERLNATEVPIGMTTQSVRQTQPDLQTTHTTFGAPLLTALSELMILLLCLIPGLFFSYQTIQEPWTMFRIARASMSMDAQHILSFMTSGAGYRSEHIGGEMLQVALLSATQWPLEAIGLLPIGSLLIAVLYYVVARMVSSTRWAPAAITVYAGWYYPGLYSQFGTETYAWTHSLFLTFLILFLLWLRNRTPILSILIMVIFTSTFLHYHTTPLWIIVALSVGIIALRNVLFKESLRPAISWAIVLFCIVLYFSFDTVFYGNGLARLNSEATNESFIQGFLSKIVAPLFAKAPALGPFEMAPINPRIATWSTLLVLLSLTIPVGLWCLQRFIQAVSSRSLRRLVQEQEDVFVWAIICVAIAHMVIYSTYGAISIRVIPLAFPLLLPVVARSLRRSKIFETALTSGLAVCAVVGFLSVAPTLAPDTTASEAGLASKLIEPGSRVLADANVYGSLLLRAAEDNQLLDFTWIDSDLYTAMVGQKSIDWSKLDYIAVDMSNKPIISSGWVFYEPWTRHIGQISQNPQLDKIYDSENLMLFVARGTALPTYEIVATDLHIRPQNTVGDMLAVMFAVICLLLFPGGVFALILQLSFHRRDFTWYVLLGLSIGLSLAILTFVGYLVNFTSLGLDMLVPLAIGIPLVTLLLYLLVRRPPMRFGREWGARCVALLLVVAVWAALATQVAEARAQRHAHYTEFFVTQGSGEDEALRLHIVNRRAQPTSYSITIERSGEAVELLAPTLVAPDAIVTVPWQVTSDLTDQPIAVVLRQDGHPYRDLLLRDAQLSGRLAEVSR